MENPKIIICDCDHKDVNNEKAVFDAAGMEFKWLQCTTQEAVIEQCQGAVCFLNQYVRMDRKIFEAIPTLKCIVRYGVGVDNVNLKDATEFGVQVCSVPDYGTNEVADHALALMMAVTRKIHLIANLTEQGVWDYVKTVPVRRFAVSTIGILGCGRIGQAFARRAHSLGSRVIAYDPLYGTPGFQTLDFVEYLSQDEVLAQSDIVSLHSALNEETAGMMNAETFGKMKDGAYFINVSRGGLVDEAALDAALTSGKLAGAGIDVVCKEPLGKDSPLFRHENVVITPHMAWYSEESAKDLKTKCAEEAVRFMKGEPVRCPVNKL